MKILRSVISKSVFLQGYMLINYHAESNKKVGM